MRARPQVRTYLLATKLKRWAHIGAYPSCYPNFPAFTAVTTLGYMPDTSLWLGLWD
jgi:hypothetical protein